MTGEALRPLRIVRAFAIAAAGPRDHGRADAVLAAARPAYPGEYEFVGKVWPEMASFLASHGMAASPLDLPSPEAASGSAGNDAG